jgi:GTPase SAR1 family protein
MLLGPPSSGKTTLAKQITSQLQDDGIPKFHSLTIDLRSVDTTREGAFLEAFLDNAKIAGKRSKVWKDLTSEMLVSFGPLSTKVGGSKLSSGTSAENVFQATGRQPGATEFSSW